MRKFVALFSVCLFACYDSSPVSEVTHENIVQNYTYDAGPVVSTPMTCAVDNNDGGINRDIDGGLLANCSIGLQQSKGFIIKLISHECEAFNGIILKSPVNQVLTANEGCTIPVGTEWRFNGPFNNTASVSLEVTSSIIYNPPVLTVRGEYPVWHLAFEDGGDQDLNDIMIDIIAIQ
jgi:hypothetical protein